MAGIEGQLFSDLALTLSIAVISSLICAMTLIPVANKLWPDTKIKSDPYQAYWHKVTHFVVKLTNNRVKQLSWIISLLGGSIFITYALLPQTDFMPRAPTDGFFYTLLTPPGGNIQFMEAEIASRVKKRVMPYYEGENWLKLN